MKKFVQYFLALAAFALVTVVSCTKTTEADTDQYNTNQVVLQAYGPQPVVRGGVLRFVGSNLDKVVSVTIPENNVITDIEVVSSGVHSEIRVTVPKETAAPGYPVLTLADGKTITGKTQLTYDEPITIESMTPASVYPGDQVTFTGDYLNTIHEVIFTKDVKVSEADFVEHTRYKIVVKVPAEAQTGVVGLGTIDEATAEEDVLKTLNIIETEEELTVGTANGKLAESTLKAGETVTVNGDHLKLVDKLMLGFTEIKDFTATDAKITFTLPADAADGDVILVMASGVEVVAGTITSVNPVVSSVAPSPVRPGAELTITGSDLDLVNSVQVPSGDSSHEWVEFNLTDGKLVFTVPADATGADIVLHKANGTTVAAAYTLVVPTVTAVTPLPVPAGEDFTVSGTDLDLVSAVKIGDQEMEFEVASATELTVHTAAATLAGTLTVVTANGTEVSFETPVTFDYGSVTQVTSLTEKAAPGETVTMTGSGFNAIEAIYIGGVKVTSYSKREDAEMVFLMPEVEPGTYAPEFHLTTGETESPAGFSITYEEEGGPIITNIWSGEQYIDWSGNSGEDKKALSALAWGGYDSDFANVVPGTILQICFTENTEFNYWQIELRRGADWGQLPEPVHYDLEAGQTVVEYTLTAANLAEMQVQHGLVITGCNLTITKVNLVVMPVEETQIWSGEQYIDWSGNSGEDKKALSALAWGGYDSDFASVTAGKTLCIYFEENTAFDYWQIELRRGADWGQLPEQVHYDLEAGQTVVECVLSAANLAEIQSQHGLVITGCNLTITKVSLK